MIFWLPYCTKDRLSAIRSLEWMFDLDGLQERHECWLLASKPVSDAENNEVVRAARKAFKTVFLAKQLVEDESGWPTSCNSLWVRAARVMHENRKPWLWLEPDAIPLKSRWLDALEEEYGRIGKPFLGAWHDQPVPHLNGIAIYPPNIEHYNSALLNPGKIAWDLVNPQTTLRHAHLSQLIQHKWSGNGQSIDAPPMSFMTDQDMEVLHPNAVIFHRCKDGSLINRLRNRIASKKVRSFYHSGDLGDILYGLLVIKSMGGGKLILGPFGIKSNFQVRELMTRQRFDCIAPLLEKQPYISSVEFAETQPQDVDYDLNCFRQWLHDEHENLAELHLRRFGQPVDFWKSAWLTVDNPIRIEGKPVIISRSPRYHSQFPWHKVMHEYAGKCVFLGLPAEAKAFQDEFGPLLYRPTANLLEVARLIAGAALFIGNQSSPYAIAEGMKKPVIQEVWPGGRNVTFPRPRAIFSQGPDVSLPKLHASERSLKITFRTLLDSWSGLGQIACQTIIGLSERGHQLTVCPFDGRLNRQYGGIPPEIEAMLGKPEPGGLEIVFEAVDYMVNCLTPGCVAMVIWESSRFPQAFIDQLNAKARLVIVPNKWNAESLVAQGIKPPVKVCQYGIDTEVFARPNFIADIWGNCKTTFGASGRISHGVNRKNLDGVIEAFKEAFTKGENVELRIKILDDEKVNVDDPRIKVHAGYLTNEDMAKWYIGNTAFVSASRGEGWGLQLHQAMAVGCCPIACVYGGQAEFFSGEVGFPVGFDEVEITDGPYKGLGKWSNPRREFLVNAMRNVYCNKNRAHYLGFMASERAKEFTIARYVENLEKILLEL